MTTNLSRRDAELPGAMPGLRVIYDAGLVPQPDPVEERLAVFAARLGAATDWELAQWAAILRGAQAAMALPVLEDS